MSLHLPEKFVFMRHGIAVAREEFKGNDSERPLTDRGIERTQAVAKTLFHFYTPDLIIHSDYKRAVQTAKIMQSALSDSAKEEVECITTKTLRPDSDWNDWTGFLSDFFRSHKSGYETVLTIGHEYSISHFFARHLGLKTSIGTFKKAGIGILEPANLNSGSLIAYIPPKIMRLTEVS